MSRRAVLTARLAALLAVGAAWPTVAAPASAGAAVVRPCTPGAADGPRCTWWRARVLAVADGDTIDARIAGVGTRTVRVTGINAMELTRYSRDPARRAGACHGLEANAGAERVIRRSRWRVRLAAQRPSSHSRGRLRRSVWVRSRGRWRDLAAIQLAAGRALWLPNVAENARDRRYGRLAQRAAAARRGLYAPTACSAGPADDLPLDVVVHWDADGDDNGNVDGEWVEVRNRGDRPLSLRGWWLRDSDLRVRRGVPGYAFPSSAVVPAGGALRVRVGCGTDRERVLHWCLDESVFDNTGDGGYLFDPDGDLRASFIYPCRVACRNPLAGRVAITVRARAPEAIAITNRSEAPVDLGDHVLKLRNRHKRGTYVFGYPFSPGSVLPPGETMRVLPGGDPENDSTFVRHVGRDGHALADRGGAVELRTAADVLAGCGAWGTGAC